jgi:hypothetical protein
MEILVGVLVVAFLVGLISRRKGDGLLDTLSTGCGNTFGCIITIIIIVVIAVFAAYNS